MHTKAHAGGWQEIEPEIVKWKTGGVLKRSATALLSAISMPAREKSAATDAAFEGEFLVVVPDGVSISKFRMLRLHSRAESREFRLVTGGVFHQSGGSDRDAQGFTHTRIAPNTYLVKFERYNGGGEYGFLPPPTFAQTPVYMGKIYCFRMRN